VKNQREAESFTRNDPNFTDEGDSLIFLRTNSISRDANGKGRRQDLGRPVAFHSRNPRAFLLRR
jgi:hypothetical protein